MGNESVFKVATGNEMSSILYMTDWLSKYNGNVCGSWKTINFKTSSKTSKNQISERSRRGCCSKSPWPHCHKSMLVRTTAEEQRVVSKNATNSSMLKFARMNATQNVVVSLLTSPFGNHLHRAKGKQSICFQIKTFLTGDLKMCSSATLHSNARALNLILISIIHNSFVFFCSRDVIWDKERWLLTECLVLSPALDYTLFCNLFCANALQTCSFAVRNWDTSSESNTDEIKIPPLSLINNHTHKHPGLSRDQKKKMIHSNASLSVIFVCFVLINKGKQRISLSTVVSPPLFLFVLFFKHQSHWNKKSP